MTANPLTPDELANEIEKTLGLWHGAYSGAHWADDVPKYLRQLAKIERVLGGFHGLTVHEVIDCLRKLTALERRLPLVVSGLEHIVNNTTMSIDEIRTMAANTMYLALGEHDEALAEQGQNS